MIARLAACLPKVAVQPSDLETLKRQLVEDKGWYRGLSDGDGSKGVYVQLIDGSLLSTAEPADKAVETNRGGGGVSSAKTALVTCFLECFALFWAVLRRVLPQSITFERGRDSRFDTTQHHAVHHHHRDFPSRHTDCL